MVPTRIDLNILGKNGHYPAFLVRHKSFVFCPSPEVVWCAVNHRAPEATYEGIEIFTYFPEEVRLLAAISLSAGDPWDKGRFCICPWLRQKLKAEQVPSFDSKEFIPIVTEVALKVAASSSIVDLTAFPDKGYSLGNGQGSEKAVVELVEAINPEDHLLIGGLSRFLSTQRLSATYALFEEASLMALLSLEAALEYIRQVLSEQTGKSASFKDVHELLAESFPEGEWFRGWLTELYESRLFLVHPSNRMGEWWTAPMFREDLWDLLRWLVLIYRFILLGEVPEAYDEQE